MNKYFVFYGLKIDDVNLLVIKEEIEALYLNSVPEYRRVNFSGGEKAKLLMKLADAVCNNKELLHYLHAGATLATCSDPNIQECSLIFPICLFSLKEFDNKAEAEIYRHSLEVQIENAFDLISSYERCVKEFIGSLSLGAKEEEFVRIHKPGTYLIGIENEAN